MSRPAVRLILDVVGTFLLALAFLTGWFLLISDDGVTEGLRVLINFMDVGLAIWIVLLIVFGVRQRTVGGVRAGSVYLFLLVGVVLNAIVVLVVGFVQGGWGPLLVLFAVQAGLACLVAAAVVVPVVHRALR